MHQSPVNFVMLPGHSHVLSVEASRENMTFLTEAHLQTALCGLVRCHISSDFRQVISLAYYLGIQELFIIFSHCRPVLNVQWDFEVNSQTVKDLFGDFVLMFFNILVWIHPLCWMTDLMFNWRIATNSWTPLLIFTQHILLV